MVIRIRILLLGFIVLSIGAMFFDFYVLTTEEKTDGLLNIEKSQKQSDSKSALRKINYSGTKDGRLAFKMDALGAEFFDDYVKLNGIDAVFYGDDGSQYNVKSRDGYYFETNQKISLSGKVIMTGGSKKNDGSGYGFRSSSLEYDLDNMIATTEDEIHLSSIGAGGAGTSIKGRGMKFDINRKEFFVLSQVEAVINEGSL